jgi:peptidylprolyl isomerase
MIPLLATLIGRSRRLVAVAAFALATLALGDPAMAIDAENVLVMELTGGTVTIEMRPDLAPNHVARIRELVRQGFYDGIVFHRVIAGFMAQTGDPTGTGSGGSGQHLKAEFSQAPHNRGTLSMARTNDPDSADSQFFICLDRADYLDGQYTVWGQVVSGMEAVDKIKKGSQSNNGAVTKPDSILSLRVAADIPDWQPPTN